MPRHLSAYARERLVRLWQQAKTPVQVVRELVKEDIVTTRHTVRRRIFCWTKDTGLADRSEQVRAAFCGNEEDGRVHEQKVVLRTNLILPPFLQADVNL